VKKLRQRSLSDETTWSTTRRVPDEVASMKKEVLGSLWARQRRRTNHCALKIEFPENPHIRVENPHGRMPARLELTENPHGRVEIPHGRVKSWFPDKHRISRYTQTRYPHGRVEIPHACVDARFLGYLSPISELLKDILFRSYSGLFLDFSEDCG